MSPRVSRVGYLRVMASFRPSAGSKASKAGTSFEADVAVYLEACARRGLVLADRLNLPTAPGPEPHLRRVAGTAPYDFTGTLGVETPWPGRSFAIECKHTSKVGRSLRIKTEKQHQGLGRDQLERLILLHAWGAMTALVWRNEHTLGLIDGAGLVLVKRRMLKGETRIQRERFRWLDRDSLEFIPPLIQSYRVR